MRVENARRLTGLGFFLPGPGAAVELWVDAGEDRDAAIHALRRRLDTLLPRLGLEAGLRLEHPHRGGVTVAVGSPIDRALALADALEWAALDVAGQASTSLDEAVQAFMTAIQTEADPSLLSWQRRAVEARVAFLWDDDEVSFGLGRHALVLPARGLPETLDLERCRGRVPVGLITGTNGKTTTTRMTAAILRAAGHRVGATSTDAITLDGAIVEEGDWTGPGAARKVLRHPEVTAAVLETARGGILRRGLGYDQADAALVTNVGADHLGEYGIDTVAEMAAVKAVVWGGVRDGGKRLANLGCPATLEFLRTQRPEAVGGSDWILLSVEGDTPELAKHLAASGEGWSVRLRGAVEVLVHHRGQGSEDLIEVGAIPATVGGTARHNVANALAAAALAHALGASLAHIASALSRFGLDPDDNPGRLERYELGGVRLLLDFAHNPHGVHALAPSVRQLRGDGRLFVALGQAGDRSQVDLDQLAVEVAALGPDEVYLRPMPGYERGRTYEEMRVMFFAAFERAGVALERLSEAAGEVDFLERVCELARPGDLVVVLVHYQRAEVRAWLAGQLSR